MDEIIKKAFENADVMATLVSQKNILKLEFSQNLIFYENGGTFTVSKELINFVKTLIDVAATQSVVLIDDNDIPVTIENTSTFFDKILSIYFEAVNEFYNKYNLLIKNRTPEKLVDFYD
jgi:hypothetical protein